MDIIKAKTRFHESLAVDTSQALLKKLYRIFGKSLPILCNLEPPVFIRNDKDGAYILVARHYSYDILLHHAMNGGEHEIPALIISEAEIGDVLSAADIELQALNILKPKLTPAGQSRKKHRQAGLICPLCGSMLQGPKNGEAIEDGQNKGFYKITCLKKNDKKNPCDFRSYLAPGEFTLFHKREYPTAQWLQKIEGKSCEKCQKRLFRRIWDEKQYDICEDNLREKGTCTYRKRL